MGLPKPGSWGVLSSPFIVALSAEDDRVGGHPNAPSGPILAVPSQLFLVMFC